MKKILQILDYILFRICDSALFFNNIETLWRGGVAVGFSIYCGVQSVLILSNTELSVLQSGIFLLSLVLPLYFLCAKRGTKWYNKMYEKYRYDEDWSVKGFFIQVLLWSPIVFYFYTLFRIVVE